MGLFKSKKNKRLFILVTSIVSFLLVIFIVCAIYVNDYYRSDKKAIEAYQTINEVNVEYQDEMIVVSPSIVSEVGFIFYPGGKVEYDSYLPLMKQLASEGITSFLLHMSFNLAVLDINAADGIIDEYSNILNWYIGGHSLGGSMAASYLSKHTDEYKGLILLGSYSTSDLSDTNLKVLSIYGSEDKVLNKDKYNENINNYPKSFKEVIIYGGCHAYFGMYGNQKGDGVATISSKEQIEITANEIINFIKE